MAALSVYVPSGRIEKRAWLVFIAFGVPLALVFGWAYANALRIVTWRPAHSLLALAFWVSLAVLAGLLAERSRSRSPRFNRWAGVAIGCVAWWAHWIVFLKSTAGSAVAADFLASGPLGWVTLIGEQASEQSDAMRWLTWTLWAAEAALTIAFPASLARSAAEEPFSEARGRFAESVFKGELVVPGASSRSFAAALQERGVEPLLTALPASSLVGESVAAQWWTIQVEGLAVEEDPSARWLNVTLLTQSRGEGRSVRVTKESAARAWHVGAAEFEAVRHRLNPADPITSAAPPVSDPGAQPTPPALQPAVDALEQERFADAFASASKSVDASDPQTRADALRLCALAASGLAHWDASFAHFERLFALEPTVFNALQLATTSVMAGALARGQVWLAKAHDLNTETKEMLPPRLDTAFLSALEQSGEHEAALPLIDKLAVAYQALPTLDDHVVWSYGLPFLGEFLRKSLQLLQQCRSPDEIVAWYARLRDGLAEDGAAVVEAQLRTLGAVAPTRLR